MNYSERALLFDCQGDTLVGVLSQPEAPLATAVLVIVGGPQYRAGSHRQFVLLARALAQAGYPVLRFDCRGMGDSGGEPHDFEHIAPDIAAALDTLKRELPTVRGVVLWGLCDGASAALLYLHDHSDPRVCGLVLVNPWVRTEAGQARTQVKHYYLQRLRERAFWFRLLRGHVASGAMAGLLRSVRTALAPAAATTGPAAYPQRMAAAWAAFGGPVLLMLSEHDHTAREFEDHRHADAAWQRALAFRVPTHVDLHGADHTCSQPAAQAALQRATLDWMHAGFAG